MIERAYKKLALDALVIQQGRLAEQKSKFLMTSAKCIGSSIGRINFYRYYMQLSIRMSCFKW